MAVEYLNERIERPIWCSMHRKKMDHQLQDATGISS